MIDGHDAPPPSARSRFAMFLAAMTAGRWFGPGCSTATAACPSCRALGAASRRRADAVRRSPGTPVAFVGAVLWGVGVSLGFPVGMSAGADDPAARPRRVSVVSSIGYTAFLAGPPLIGFLGQHRRCCTRCPPCCPARAGRARDRRRRRGGGCLIAPPDLPASSDPWLTTSTAPPPSPASTAARSPSAPRSSPSSPCSPPSALTALPGIGEVRDRLAARRPALARRRRPRARHRLDARLRARAVGGVRPRRCRGAARSCSAFAEQGANVLLPAGGAGGPGVRRVRHAPGRRARRPRRAAPRGAVPRHQRGEFVALVARRAGRGHRPAARATRRSLATLLPAVGRRGRDRAGGRSSPAASRPPSRAGRRRVAARCGGCGGSCTTACARRSTCCATATRC